MGAISCFSTGIRRNTVAGLSAGRYSDSSLPTVAVLPVWMKMLDREGEPAQRDDAHVLFEEVLAELPGLDHRGAHGTAAPGIPRRPGSGPPACE